MNCTEARNRIDTTTEGHALTDDTQLHEHLKSCADCRAYIEASGVFEQALQTAAIDDTVPGLTLDEQRRQVEYRLKTHRTAVHSSQHHLLSRPAWRLTVSAATIALAAIMFVPFTRYTTVGYDVSVDGTCMDVALNHDGMCELLGRLGLVDAGVDLIGCDTTCSVAILDLKTEHEARMVVGAMNRLCKKNLISNIVPIRTKSSRTLLERANDLIQHDES
jgi:hypothetical protein